MRHTSTFLLQAALCWPLISHAEPPSKASTPIIGGPCQGCELVFVDLPAEPTASARIAPPEEPGEPLILEGTVRRLDGSPAAGIIVYAYHTDATGVYPRGTTIHGRLRGWTRTDEAGRYRFTTIRPAGYPDGAECAHIHMHVIEPGIGTYYIDNVIFDDDPDVSRQLRARARTGRAGSGLTYPINKDGRWHVKRDILLGRHIPDYPEAAARTAR